MEDLPVVVSVQFFGTQRALTKTRDIKIQLTNNGRVKDVFRHLLDCYPDFPLKEEEAMITVNNRATNMNHVLRPEDRVVFLPHLGGG